MSLFCKHADGDGDDIDNNSDVTYIYDVSILFMQFNKINQKKINKSFEQNCSDTLLGPKQQKKN